MTVTFPSRRDAATGSVESRFRLTRAGVLNVWQYDEQVFEFADGRLLLRGANGAGKSKTLEILLPFALDGDKARITASARHHTSLLWLMTDGYGGQTRVGYVWVEFGRVRGDGSTEAFTCGVGIRASAAARTATAWHFTTSRRVGHDLSLEDDAGPLPRTRLEEVLGDDGQVFDRAVAYKEHVGRALFGLEPEQYDEVLRLLYWLRQPQVGEDIEPARLAEQLSQALPQLHDQALKTAGATFDELTAFGEQIERRAAASRAIAALAEAYASYARATVAGRARAAAEALRIERHLRSEVTRAEQKVAATESDRAAAEAAQRTAETARDDVVNRLHTLESSPEARDQVRLTDLAGSAARDARVSDEAAARVEGRQKSVAAASAAVLARADQVLGDLAEFRNRVRGIDSHLRESVPRAGPTTPGLPDEPTLDRLDRGAQYADVVTAAGHALAQARTSVSHRLSAVGVVREAIGVVESAHRDNDVAEREAEQAEARWEEARRRRMVAQGDADDAERALRAALTTWTRSPQAPAVAVPDELTESTVSDLPDRARRAAAPRLATLRDDLSRTEVRREGAAREVARLRSERAEVEALQGAAPPAPSLPRTPRPDGHSLWQVVDFADGLDDRDRAGLEAALQDAGLLDAWVRPGGRLLDAAQNDVVLGAGDMDRGTGRSLADVLVPDLPADSGLAAGDVMRILGAVAIDGEGSPRVGTDGCWRLGPAHGRTAKERAQYIGATARAQERARRLAAIDDALHQQATILQEAQDAAADLGAEIAGLERWAAAVPSGGPLTRAWTVLGERLGAEQVQESENATAQTSAQLTRAALAQARRARDRLAAEHDVPAEPDRLGALEARLRNLDQELLSAVDRIEPIRRGLRDWQGAFTARGAAEAELAEECERADHARSEALASQAALDELRASVGNTVRELEVRMAELRTARDQHRKDEADARQRLDELVERLGAARREAEGKRERVSEHALQRASVLATLTATAHAPGLLDAADVDADVASTLAGIETLPAGQVAPRALEQAADRLAGLSADDPERTKTALWHAYNAATSGPGSDLQPTVSEFGDLLAVSGRDDAGEAELARLAARVRSAVDRDRAMLTDREKQQFEQHVLGELGDEIRRCRRDAEELVTAMNALLGGVTTSQGIRVKLDWDLRDDVSPEARESVRLLAQPVGSLLPEERGTLREVLHRLIEESRGEHPELSYAEHLAAALDYRTWSEFVIRYTRPETPGKWDKLHRRSALSQGEQKVLCYLPLFAAAAAHFSSLAGAAPHAPRLVLLDDAFPKIDVRTHPLLFRLLIDLDLDFVVTSERLWGDYETMPSLAIYEALRDPAQRGIAQYEYRWDGRTLHSLG